MRGISSNTLTRWKDTLGDDFNRLVVEHVKDLVLLTDRHGIILYASPSFDKLLPEAGLKPGADILEKSHPADRARQKKLFREILSKGRGPASEFRLVLGNEEVRHIEWEGFRIQPPGGGSPCVVIISRDVTKRKESENE